MDSKFLNSVPSAIDLRVAAWRLDAQNSALDTLIWLLYRGVWLVHQFTIGRLLCLYLAWSLGYKCSSIMFDTSLARFRMLMLVPAICLTLKLVYSVWSGTVYGPKDRTITRFLWYPVGYVWILISLFGLGTVLPTLTKRLGRPHPWDAHTEAQDHVMLAWDRLHGDKFIQEAKDGIAEAMADIAANELDADHQRPSVTLARANAALTHLDYWRKELSRLEEGRATELEAMKDLESGVFIDKLRRPFLRPQDIP